MELVPRIEKPLKDFPAVSKISFVSKRDSSCTETHLSTHDQIRNARHAVRVLQYADIAQIDWTPDQFIVARYPSEDHREDPSLACVLIDFALAKMGDIFYEAEKDDDWGDLAASFILDKDDNEDGCELELVRKYYDPPEPWDCYANSTVMDDK